MRVKHPDASEGERVHVDGHVATVEDGTFELPAGADGWLQRWLDANDYDRDEVVVTEAESAAESDSSDDATDASDAGEERESYTPAFDPGAYSVADLRDELDERDLSDDELVTLLAAEDAGEDRTTAKDAIKTRIEG